MRERAAISYFFQLHLNYVFVRGGEKIASLMKLFYK